MITTKIFWSSVEYKYREDHEQYPRLKGGFVAMLLRAKDAREALAAIVQQFSEMELDLVQVEYIRPYDLGMEWTDEEVAALYMVIYKKARKSDDIQFHIFYEYGDEPEKGDR